MIEQQRIYSTGDLIESRYRVEKVKRGNMGIVYLCSDDKTSDAYAIKTYDSRFLVSSQSQNNFLNEASTWIHLERHPNIVEAKFLHIIDRHPYLFLERVTADNPRGATLKDLFFTQTLECRRMIQIAIHICDGMIHAINKFPHLVHRDLKSENVLIGLEGLPKVSDFGMTYRPEPEQEKAWINRYDRDMPFHPAELARRMEGTPAYASPEQCQCQPLDTRADIYSFGCILYHMTTKSLPFHKPTVEETIVAQIREQPQPPWERSNTIPKEISDLILVCLEKRPENRFDSFDAVRNELIDLYENTYEESPHSFQVGIPLTVEEYMDRGESFALLGQYDHARAEVMKGLHLDPERSELFYLLGKFSFLEGQFRRALLELKEALCGLSQHADLHTLIGQAYLELDFLDEAQLHFRESIRLDAAQSAAYQNLFDMYLKRGDTLLAEEIVQQALKVCKDTIPFYLRLATLYKRQEKYQEQFAVLQKVYSENPQNIDVLLDLAEISLRLKREHQANLWVERAAKSRPKTFDAFYRLGRLYRELKNLRRAAEIWKNAAATGKGNGAFYREIAELLTLIRSYDEAWRYVLRAEEKGEDVDSLKYEIQARRLRRR